VIQQNCNAFTAAATSDPRLDLLGLINGFQITQAIRVASILRVADHLSDGARSAGELAALTESHPDSLYRLLRALAAVGVFREDEGQNFTLTPMGDCLRSESATPIGAWAEVVGSPYFWQPGVISCTASEPARMHFKI
jgi:hypothetical protein